MDSTLRCLAAGFKTSRSLRTASLLVALASSTLVIARSSAQATTPAYAASCPVQVLKFHPDGVSIRIRNVSGKPIVGMTYFVALADATEHWQWLHWDFDRARNLREFGWNKTIKPNESKTLSWDYSNLDFTHGGGGDFVLASVLFADGSKWEESPARSECNTLWLNQHKASFVRPIDLPPY